MGIDAEILLIGGGSRIAGVLAEALGARARCITRRPTGHPGDLIVDDYANIPARWFDGVRCVVQCVGISSGDEAALDRINADLPRTIAVAARAAGVRHMVHISSFSVYGRARAIDAATPVAPTGAYGRSKLRGDRALLALADDGFRPTILRLPLVYGGRTRGKLEQLIGLWSRVRVLPVPARDVRRAMIGVDLSAEVILRLIDTAPGGVVLAADPMPFAYADAARARRRRLYRMALPTAVTRLVEHVSPGIGERLFADSSLADADNIAVTFGLPSRLYRDIASIDPS